MASAGTESCPFPLQDVHNDPDVRLDWNPIWIVDIRSDDIINTREFPYLRDAPRNRVGGDL